MMCRPARTVWLGRALVVGLAMVGSPVAARAGMDFPEPNLTQRGIHRAHPSELASHTFPAGSMGPKVESACQFALATGHSAAIGALADIPAIVRGEKGTLVDRGFEGVSYHG